MGGRPSTSATMARAIPIRPIRLAGAGLNPAHPPAHGPHPRGCRPLIDQPVSSCRARLHHAETRQCLWPASPRSSRRMVASVLPTLTGGAAHACAYTCASRAGRGRHRRRRLGQSLPAAPPEVSIRLPTRSTSDVGATLVTSCVAQPGRRSRRCRHGRADAGLFPRGARIRHPCSSRTSPLTSADTWPPAAAAASAPSPSCPMAQAGGQRQ